MNLRPTLLILGLSLAAGSAFAATPGQSSATATSKPAVAAKAKPADLDQPRPNHLGQDLRVGHIVGILLDELVHHGAEIALLRDLYLRVGD